MPPSTGSRQLWTDRSGRCVSPLTVVLTNRSDFCIQNGHMPAGHRPGGHGFQLGRCAVSPADGGRTASHAPDVLFPWNGVIFPMLALTMRTWGRSAAVAGHADRPGSQPTRHPAHREGAFMHTALTRPPARRAVRIGTRLLSRLGTVAMLGLSRAPATTSVIGRELPPDRLEAALRQDHRAVYREADQGFPLHPGQLQRHAGQSPHLRRHPAVDHGARPERQSWPTSSSASRR